MQRNLQILCLGLGLVLFASTSCAPDYAVVPTEPFLNLTGRYHSSEPLGEIGTLTLEIRRLENEPWFKAWLAESGVDSGVSEGIGTLGDNHLILNFDRGLNSDFYFEGDVESGGGSDITITGTFIFPDRPEKLSVVFEFVEPLPPLPPEDS